jgi:hypothetical protein
MGKQNLRTGGLQKKSNENALNEKRKKRNLRKYQNKAF